MPTRRTSALTRMQTHVFQVARAATPSAHNGIPRTLRLGHSPRTPAGAERERAGCRLTLPGYGRFRSGAGCKPGCVKPAATSQYRLRMPCVRDIECAYETGEFSSKQRGSWRASHVSPSDLSCRCVRSIGHHSVIDRRPFASRRATCAGSRDAPSLRTWPSSRAAPAGHRLQITLHKFSGNVNSKDCATGNLGGRSLGA